MIDKDFLLFLESQISKALSNAEEKEARRYWCDGILLSEIENDIKSTKEIIAVAMMPQGQYEEKEFRYKMIIKFGNSSYEKFNKGKDLTECVPQTDNDNWILIDPVDKTIEIQLL